jgi:hypothetical protein
MFKIANWFALGFSFTHNGMTYVKAKHADNFSIDGCEWEVFEDDAQSHIVP